MPKIERLFGREILDSRGKPTVLATCVLEGGVAASASVPSGASTGAAEAFELRDADPTRYRGSGCRRAAANIGGELHRELAGRIFADQAELDETMIALDGTPTKSRLGANAILAVSVAFARAFALWRQVPLYRHFAEMLGSPAEALPRLTINLFSGGKHAGQQVSIQDVLIVPMSAQTVDELLWRLLRSINQRPSWYSRNTGCGCSPPMKVDWRLHLKRWTRCLFSRWRRSSGRGTCCARHISWGRRGLHSFLQSAAV